MHHHEITDLSLLPAMNSTGAFCCRWSKYRGLCHDLNSLVENYENFSTSESHLGLPVCHHGHFCPILYNLQEAFSSGAVVWTPVICSNKQSEVENGWKSRKERFHSADSTRNHGSVTSYQTTRGRNPQCKGSFYQTMSRAIIFIDIWLGFCVSSTSFHGLKSVEPKPLTEDPLKTSPVDQGWNVFILTIWLRYIVLDDSCCFKKMGWYRIRVNNTPWPP